VSSHLGGFHASRGILASEGGTAACAVLWGAGELLSEGVGGCGVRLCVVCGDVCVCVTCDLSSGFPGKAAVDRVDVVVCAT